MNAYHLRLMSPTKLEQIDGIVSFIAKDSSGSFGILANACRRLTALSFGMASLKKRDGSVEYLALPGGVLYFSGNVLKIATTSFVRSLSIDEISVALDKKIRVEEDSIQEIKRSLHRLDDEILRRISAMSRPAGRRLAP